MPRYFGVFTAQRLWKCKCRRLNTKRTVGLVAVTRFVYEPPVNIGNYYRADRRDIERRVLASLTDDFVFVRNRRPTTGSENYAFSFFSRRPKNPIRRVSRDKGRVENERRQSAAAAGRNGFCGLHNGSDRFRVGDACARNDTEKRDFKTKPASQTERKIRSKSYLRRILHKTFVFEPSSEKIIFQNSRHSHERLRILYYWIARMASLSGESFTHWSCKMKSRLNDFGRCAKCRRISRLVFNFFCFKSTYNRNRLLFIIRTQIN